MIVRTMLANAKFPNVCAEKPACKQQFECTDFASCTEDFPNPTNEFKVAQTSDWSSDLFENVDCPGFTESTKICAANGDSYDNPNGWLIALKPLWIKLNGEESKESFVRN